MNSHQAISILAFAAALSAFAGSYTENANTVKQISSPGGYDSCVTNGTAWAGGIAPNLNQTKAPSNPAAAGKEFFTPKSFDFRTLKDPPSSWGALKVEYPVHIEGSLTPASAYTTQPMSFSKLSLYDNSKIVLNTNAGFKDSEIWIRSGSGTPFLMPASNKTFYFENCKVCGYSGSGLKIYHSGTSFVVRSDDSFRDFNGTILLGPGTDTSIDTKFRLTANFKCPGDVIARQHSFLTVDSTVRSQINLRRLELKGGTLELTAGSYATFTNLVLTTKPYGNTPAPKFSPVSETLPVVTVLDSVSFAAAAKPYPIQCSYTAADSSVCKSFPLIRAKGTLNAADFTLASAPKANSILVTTYDAATEMTTLWLKETVALTANDSSYDSSFTNSVRWTDAKAPHADADYYVPAGKILRTQKDYYDGLMTFAGRSLYLGGEFQTTTRWSAQETEKNAFAVIPELHGLAGSQWLLNCMAALSNSTLVVEAPAASPFKVNYNVDQQYGSIGLFDVTLKGAPGSMIRFASTYNKMNTVSWNGAADEFYGTINASTNYTFAVSGDLTMPGTMALAKNDVLQANGGVVTIGTLTLGDPSVTLELAAKEVEGVETPGRIVATSALTATTPIKVAVPLTKSVHGGAIVTDLLTFPKGETALTLEDFAITGAAARVNATFEVVTDGNIQKLRMTRRQKGLAIILR